MSDKKHPQQLLRQRKFLLVLPLLVVPFVAAIFAALGGGKGNAANTAQATGSHELNYKLPDAHFSKGKENDKMAFYEQAGKDSAKLKDAIKKDPYYKKDSSDIKNATPNIHNDLKDIFDHAASKYDPGAFSKLKTSVGENEDGDLSTKKVMEKLAQLKQAIRIKPENITGDQPTINSNPQGPDIEKLGKLMNLVKQNTNNAPDSEFNQINGMLEKIMDIQHPERLQDSMRKLSEKSRPQVLPVTAIAEEQPDTSEQNGFYGLNEETANESEKSNAIEAAIEEDQEIVSGAVVKLRLLQDIYVRGIPIGKGELVYGISNLNNERLKITVNSLLSNDNILPVSLEVYDLDGLAGIYVPGSIDRDVGKQSADEAIGNIGLTNFDPSLGAQAASAGIQAAKSLMSKRVKLVQVSVKAGYKVLLKDTNQK